MPKVSAETLRLRAKDAELINLHETVATMKTENSILRQKTAEMETMRLYVVELERALKSANDKAAAKLDIETRLAEAIEDNKVHRDAVKHYLTKVNEKDREVREVREELRGMQYDLTMTRKQLDRCLGWIAKAMDQPPLGPSTGLGVDDQIPF